MTDADARSPSDHLLRTLAAVPVSSEILDLGCGRGHHTEALLRLGFPVHACDPRPEAVDATRATVGELLEQGEVEAVVQVATLDNMDYPDATFDWVVAAEAETYVSSPDDLGLLFEKARRLLKPGGWFYVSLPAVDEEGDSSDLAAESSVRFTEGAIERQREAADLAEASAPSRVEGKEAPRIRAIYRRVEPQTPV